jgi:hypothetical protein
LEVQPQNGSNIDALAATFLLSPAPPPLTAPAPRSDPITLAAPVPRPDPITLAAPVPGSDRITLTAPVPRSGHNVAGCGTTLSGANLRIAAQLADAIVALVRRHRPPPVRALRFQLCQQGGNVAAERFALFVLGHCETCKTTHATDYRNSEEYLGHVPTSLCWTSYLEPPQT